MQWLLAYLAMSMLVGLALTYYYDNPDNAKLNTILQRGLQIVGLALVAWGPALPECGALTAGVLLALHLAGGLHHLPRHAPASYGTVSVLCLREMSMRNAKDLVAACVLWHCTVPSTTVMPVG